MGETSKKVQDSRLKLYGHVLRLEDVYVDQRVMGMKVPGKEGEEDRIRDGWITSGTTCRRENCQGRKRKRKTEFNGGVS